MRILLAPWCTAGCAERPTPPDPVLCGDAACATNQMCFRPCNDLVGCFPMDPDTGACQSGYLRVDDCGHGDPGCVFDDRPRCRDAPPACAAERSCAACDSFICHAPGNCFDGKTWLGCLCP